MAVDSLRHYLRFSDLLRQHRTGRDDPGALFLLRLLRHDPLRRKGQGTGNRRPLVTLRYQRSLDQS